MKPITRLPGAFGLGAAIVLLVGCSALSIQSRKDPGSPLYPPTDPATVLVLSKAPTNRFSRVGEIILEPKRDAQPKHVAEILQREAAKLGADAVVVIANRPMTLEQADPGNWLALQEGYKIRTTVVGIAIRRLP